MVNLHRSAKPTVSEENYLHLVFHLCVKLLFEGITWLAPTGQGGSSPGCRQLWSRYSKCYKFNHLAVKTANAHFAKTILQYNTEVFCLKRMYLQSLLELQFWDTPLKSSLNHFETCHWHSLNTLTQVFHGPQSRTLVPPHLLKAGDISWYASSLLKKHRRNTNFIQCMDNSYNL